MKIFVRALLITSVFASFFVSDVKAQYVDIPDPKFKAQLIKWGFSGSISGNRLDTTSAAVLSATRLSTDDDAFSFNDTIDNAEGIQYFKNLTMLILNHSYVKTIPALPAKLKHLQCRSNPHLQGLPALPATLVFLDCSYCDMRSLPTLPNSMGSLACYYNARLTALPSLPASLTWLVCDADSLTSLPPLPAALKMLSFTSNYIANLPPLQHTRIDTLHGSNNIVLSAIPTLPNTVVSIICGNNQLTSLPALPPTLKSLQCGSNLLTGLPSLPASLQQLECGYNQINILPALPASLLILRVYVNQLSSLPVLPAGLERLECNHNQLTELPEHLNSLYILLCNDNPSLACVPLLPNNLTILHCKNTGVACLPNKPVSASFDVQNLPLCVDANPNGCVKANISGKVFKDNNGDCIYNTGDVPLENLPIKLWDTNNNLLQQSFIVNGGSYTLNAPYGTYIVRPDTAGWPVKITCPDSGYYTITLSAADSVAPDLNFGFECLPGFDISAGFVNRLWGVFGPGDTTVMTIGAMDPTAGYGLNCAAGISGEVQIAMDGPGHYLAPAAGALTPTVNNTKDTLTYTIADFSELDVHSDLRFLMLIDTTAAAQDSVTTGSVICFTASVTPTAGDYNPANNIYHVCYTVTNSWDPNAKEVDRGEEIDTAQTWLTYTIHFQNTGTGRAKNIYLTDTLSQYVDENTFTLIDYSFQPVVKLNGKAIRFNLFGIYLVPKDTNELASQGYVKYKVRTKANLPLGTQVFNTGYIYFDYNPAVVTNTTVNTVALPTGIMQVPEPLSSFNIFPNPSSGQLYIQTTGFQPSLVAVYNLNGEKVLEQKYSQQIDIGQLSAGMYLLEVRNMNTVMRKKLEKM